LIFHPTLSKWRLPSEEFLMSISNVFSAFVNLLIA
jgi:hypothetical protein